MLRAAEKGSIKILPGLFAGRMELNRRYLKELDTRCLLQNYYLEAAEIMEGIQVVNDPSAARLHWGWESPTCQLRGHFLGHWLSAAAALVALDGDSELRVKVEYIVDELSRLQKRNGRGWVAPIPEKYFELLKTDSYIWSPQYTMHKLLMGLSHVYRWLGNEKALEVLQGLADWYLAWTERMERECPAAVFAGEQAGMLETWAELYAASGDERFRTLAERYEKNSMFEVLDRDGDPLTDNHANASIPLMHGAAKMLEVTGDDVWRRRLEVFWKKAVTERGMYSTTGANSGEFWIPPMKEGEFISDSDQEFCTVYNMVRVAEQLFLLTGGTEYGDYIERAVYNGFLAQQSRVSGMPTYFLPMRAGSRKKWSSKRNDFWCCLGTMIQAQTLYPDLIYALDDENRRVLVSQYIPSELETEVGGARIRIRQTTGMKNYSNQAFFDERGGGALTRWSLAFEIGGDGEKELTVALRVPKWCDGLPGLVIGGEEKTDEEVKAMINGGYLELRKAFKKDEILILFRTKPAFEYLPDRPDMAAVLAGPVVLAGLTERDRPLKGDDADVILKKRTTHTYSTFPWEQDHYVTCGQEENVEFIPLYEVEDEAYTVYFNTVM